MKIRKRLTDSKEVTRMRLYTKATKLGFDRITGLEIS
jgi:hypothetical protein